MLIDKAKVFGLYLGSPVRVTLSYGDVPQEISGGLLGVCGKTKTVHVQCFDSFGHPWIDTAWYAIDLFKLILTPKELISDEDAVEVAKILYPDSEDWSKNMHTAEQGRRFVTSFDDAEEMYIYGVNYPFYKICAVIDYLRSRSYHLPYLSQNLYEAGIAIKP